jgi:PAS domain-containing protein
VVDTTTDQIADANSAAASLLGFSREALTDKRLSEVFPADHPRLEPTPAG